MSTLFFTKEKKGQINFINSKITEVNTNLYFWDEITLLKQNIGALIIRSKLAHF